jgi:hypothetical protein
MARISVTRRSNENMDKATNSMLREYRLVKVPSERTPSLVYCRLLRRNQQSVRLIRCKHGGKCWHRCKYRQCCHWVGIEVAAANEMVIKGPTMIVIMERADDMRCPNRERSNSIEAKSISFGYLRFITLIKHRSQCNRNSANRNQRDGRLWIGGTCVRKLWYSALCLVRQKENHQFSTKWDAKARTG